MVAFRASGLVARDGIDEFDDIAKRSKCPHLWSTCQLQMSDCIVQAYARSRPEAPGAAMTIGGSSNPDS
ncbi:hypothetical protein [Bradyrhizobium sp. MOS002]|uniref:hypothetical protein n=1 Tax=Bradyrhizobium sp. MOS002 TaxID=2133947 RepID=UPI001FDF7C49|nr:hypothetical protein [Bradyrhizobium sp. MOS002]